jgi:hypothetical protein
VLVAEFHEVVSLWCSCRAKVSGSGQPFTRQLNKDGQQRWLLAHFGVCEHYRFQLGASMSPPVEYTRRVQPNPSLNRTVYGRPPGPGLWHIVHHHRPGPGVLP